MSKKNLAEAISVIESLMHWRPDDMSDEEIADVCPEWDSAQEFLNKHGK